MTPNRCVHLTDERTAGCQRQEIKRSKNNEGRGSAERCRNMRAVNVLSQSGRQQWENTLINMEVIFLTSIKANIYLWVHVKSNKLLACGVQDSRHSMIWCEL